MWISSGVAGSFVYFSGLRQMRGIDHLPADRKHARVGMCFERGNDGFCMADVFRRWRESRVDDRDLGGVNSELAGEAFSPGGLGFCLQAFLILEVGEHAVDWLHTRGD